MDLGWAYSVTPATISPSALGFGLNYYLIDGWGVGVLGQYDFSGSPLPANPSRWPLQQTNWSTEADVMSVPLSAGGETSLIHLDLVLTAGIGAISTRPVAMIVASRTFANQLAVDAVAGAALRVFLTRSLSVALALRDQIYEGQTESQNSTPTGSPTNAGEYGPSQIFNRVQVGLDASYWL